MPTTFQLVETTFPNGEGKNTQEQIEGIYDYLFVLLEQLRYTLFNLDDSNVNPNAMSDFIKNIREPIYAKIEDTNKNVNELSITAQGLAARIGDAEGDITQLSARADGLAAEIKNAKGDITQLGARADGLAARISSAEGNITQLGATANGLSARISSNEGSITNLTADINGIRTQVSGKINSSEAQTLIDQSLNGITLAATSGESGTIFKLMYDGAVLASTGSVDLYVDAVNVYGTLTAERLQGSSIRILDDEGNRCGYIYSTYASSAETKIELDSDAIEIGGDEGSVFIGSVWDRSTRSYSASIEVDGNSQEVQIKGDVIPNANALYNLGSRNFVWDAIYCSTDALNGSDRNIKNSIEALPEKYVSMFERIEPKRYKLNSGTSGRFHTGFIAQEVEDAMRACGIDSQEFAGWAAAMREDGSETYFLRYSEFIPILWAKVREQEKRLKRLEGTT
nr:MAG TPA: endosialidase chaperone [Caudoviricetes sp.]